jgi:FlgD Ig-like domain
VVSFVALVLATSGAFFVVQHLKVTTPLIAGFPKAVPGTINPYGASCNGVNHGRMWISFYLLHRSDDVDVYVVNSSGTIVRTLAIGRHMAIKKRSVFSWDGREDNGTVAPDGTYYMRVALIHQGRTFQLTSGTAATPVTIKVKTVPPHPVVKNVSPSLIPVDGTPVTIRYTGTEGRSGFVDLYRTDLPGDPLVFSFRTKARSTSAVWNGRIHGLPAPAGTYLVGLTVLDAACNKGRFPLLMPPVPGTTPNAGVTVRYLAAEPPLQPVAAGSRATVYVDSRGKPYRWGLWRVGSRKESAHGGQRSFVLHVKLPPAQGAGLYHLVLRSGDHSTDVPLVASYPSPNNQPRVLVVVPALTWQGQNPVDDPPPDGIPNTLDTGGPIQLDRVLADGLPPGFADEAAFLAYLDRAHLPYDLTTDVALINGTGPTLAGHTGVVLAGAERWVPASFAAQLRAYVAGGGHLLSLGIDSLRRGVTIHGTTALHPTGPTSADALSARPGTLVTHNTDLITVIEDQLHIFSATSGAFQGYSSFEPIQVVPPGKLLSAAGNTNTTPSIVGYQLGRGDVIDIGLVGFGSSLAYNVDAKELVQTLWGLLRH